MIIGVVEQTIARSYHLYGLHLSSEWLLPYTAGPSPWLAEVALRNRSELPCPSGMDGADLHSPSRSFQWAYFPSDAVYLRWPGLAEFVVSADGREIAAHPFSDSPPEIFHTYMLGQALSFALINQGFEPLHATVVNIGGEAVAFLGEGRYGKTTLAAAFLQAGYPLLTDDLLMLAESGSQMLAYPGPARIKLLPHIARRLVPQWASGTPISRQNPKLVIPLEPRQASRTPIPLRAMYTLSAPRYPRRTIAIRRLSMRSACFALIQSTFNTRVTGSARLGRQLSMAASVANRVPVRLLAYPRRIEDLPAVCAAVLDDLRR